MKKEINIGTISRANAKSITNQLTKVVNGIGKSKVATRNSSGLTGQNGHKKSDLVHSRKSMANFRSVTQNYLQHVKDTVGGKIERSINVDTAKDFILTKLVRDGVAGSTANTYISTLAKTAEALEKLTGKVYITKAEFKVMKKEIKQEHDLSKIHINRAYENPHQIVKEMAKFSEYALSAKLQVETGMRVDDATFSKKWKLNENGSITVRDSKAGITYTTATVSKELQKEVKEAIDNGYKVLYCAYASDLKEAVERTGQKWEKNGTHGLRYNFAQMKFKVLNDEGKSYTEAKGQVSLELGHSRLSITDTYTSFKK